MSKNNNSDHYKKQLDYFSSEFGENNQYKLFSWQKTYIDRIKKELLGRNYKGKTLIDIASGSGYVAVEIARLGLDVVATDLTPEAIKNLNKYKKQFSLFNLRVVKCYAEIIPLPDKSVDFVVANAILEHIPNEKKAIDEWKRLLKKNGKIFITVPLRFRYIWPFLWPINYFHDKRIGHLRRYDLQNLQEKFNLRVLKVFYTGHLLKVISAIASLLIKSERFSEFFEKIDTKQESKRYGASNIIVLFENK
ncbi:MAG: class I SAM-dependent methyltransferase [Patescibacteria group bacterium]